jgi:acyl-CoA thioesterase-1
MRLQRFSRAIRRKAPLRVLAIGSSSTEGVGASSPANSYPARFEAELKQRFKVQDVHVTNAGIGGETAEASVARLEERLKQNNYDLVVWQVGTNDAVKGDDENRFRELLERGLQDAKTAQTELVLLDQQFYPTIKDPVRYERYVHMIGTVAAEFNTPVMSRYRLMKTWAERAPRDMTAMLAGDGFHMSDRGYECLATAMVGAVSDLVGDTASAAVLTPTTVSDAPSTQISLSRR